MSSPAVSPSKRENGIRRSSAVPILYEKCAKSRGKRRKINCSKQILVVSKRSLKGRSRKGKGEINSSFSNRCAFLSKRGRKSLIFSPRACIMETSVASGLKNRKSRRGDGRCRRKKTENGENALRTSGRTRKCAVAVRRPLRAGDERKATKRRLESRRIGGRTLRAPAFAFAGKRKKLKKPPLPGKKKMEKKR